MPVRERRSYVPCLTVRDFAPLRRTVAVHSAKPESSVPDTLIFSIWPTLYRLALGVETTIVGPSSQCSPPGARDTS